MDCPQCKNVSLQPKELELGLVAAGCSQCNGSLLSLINYRYWADQASSNSELVSSETISELNDGKGVNLCPKCQKIMTKYQIGADYSNRLDLCSHCDEAWLDNGEWQLLKELDAQDKLPSIFTEAWQTDIRVKRQEKKWRQFFEEQMGSEDFERVDAFKKWLDSKENAADIKHYLNTNLKL